MRFIRLILFPVAIIYWIFILIRNKCYDWGVCKSVAASVPTISVGNLSVGGAGKSPTVEYLIRLLQGEFKIATLSRGYGRKTKGYIEANSLSSPEEIGDEPTQFKQKFNDVTVTVCEDRAIALSMLEKKQDVILMDDAYQHRKVKPGISILLFDYNKVFQSDWILPFGNLREPMRGMNRADVILITKTPKIFSPMERRRVEGKLTVLPHQKIFYSYLRYGNLVPLQKHYPIKSFNDLDKKTQVVLLTGIADPTLLINYLNLKLRNVTHLKYPDHHRFDQKDIKKLHNVYNSIESPNKIIITTEKDAMRLKHPKLESLLHEFPVYYLPIEAEIHEKDKEQFDKLIIDYVRSGTKHY